MGLRQRNQDNVTAALERHAPSAYDAGVEPGPHRHLKVARGQWVRVHELVQRSIYADVLEGVPTRCVNERIALDAVAEGERMGTPCHLLAPVAIPLRPGEDEGKWTRERLPYVLCIARLVSGPLAADPDDDWRSELTVVWFQDDYAFPLAPDACLAMASVDWEALARSVLYA